MRPAEPLRLDASDRRRLVAAVGERPWPPPTRGELDELFVATAARILRELADEPPAGWPECADWLLLVADDRAPFLRSEPLDARVIVAGFTQWEALEAGLKRRLGESATVLRLELAGSRPAEWASRLPDDAPGAAALEARLGVQAPAVLGTLAAPAFGRLEILHAWSLGPDGPVHVADVSGVLRVRTEG